MAFPMVGTVLTITVRIDCHAIFLVVIIWKCATFMTNALCPFAIHAWSHVSVVSLRFIDTFHSNFCEVLICINHNWVSMGKCNCILNLSKILCQALRMSFCFECFLFDILTSFENLLCQFQAYRLCLTVRHEFYKLLVIRVPKLEELTRQLFITRLPDCWVIESEFLLHLDISSFHCLVCLWLRSITECKHSYDTVCNVFCIKTLDSREYVFWAWSKPVITRFHDHQNIVERIEGI